MLHNDSFFNPLRDHAARELLKFAAGHNIFCRICQRILDCKTTVHVEVRQGASCSHSATQCEKCWAKIEPQVEAAAKQHSATLDITRWPGRKVNQRKPKPTPPGPDPRQGQLNLGGKV